MGANQNHYQNTKLNGVATWNLDRTLTWTNRFVVIGDGVHADTSNAGHWTINMPAVGTAIPVAGGGTRTVTAAAGASLGGVLLNGWEALWYRLPIEAGSASVPANFTVVPYSVPFDPDEHWLCIAATEDWNDLKLADGSSIKIGESSGTKDNSLLLLNARAENQHIAGAQWVAPAVGGALAGAWPTALTEL